MNKLLKKYLRVILLVIAVTVFGRIAMTTLRKAAFFENGFSKIRLFQRSEFPCILTHDEAVKKISNLEFNVPVDLLESIGLNRAPPTDTPDIPVLLTGADDSHFMESQALIKNLHEVVWPAFPDVKLVYFDLGLNTSYRKQLEIYCRCTVVDFPFDKLPTYVRHLQTYAFKPIAINMGFTRYGHVVWMDSSIRFKSQNFSTNVYSALKWMNEKNMFFVCFNETRGKGSLVQRTVKQTFSYFSESPSCFLEYMERRAGFIAVKNNYESRTVLRQWLSCALTEQCINPPGAIIDCPALETDLSVQHTGRCHRYDQSAIGIMWYRLYPNMTLFMPPWIMVKKEHTEKYFPEL